MSKAKKKLPSICLDEHLPPYVKEEFVSEGFRCIRATESRYKGRDEAEYLGEMYSENEVFVTADEKFINLVADSGFRRHAGIVWLPKQMDREQREGFSEMAADWIKFCVRESGPFAMRGTVLYPSKDGPAVFDADGEALLISWSSLLSGPPV